MLATFVVAGLLFALVLWARIVGAPRRLLSFMKARPVLEVSPLGRAFRRLKLPKAQFELWIAPSSEKLQSVLFLGDGHFVFLLSSVSAAILTEEMMDKWTALPFHSYSPARYRILQWFCLMQARLRSSLKKRSGFSRFWWAWALHPLDRLFQIGVNSRESENFIELRKIVTQARFDHLLPVDLDGGPAVNAGERP
jgi:hypothetical protein